MAAIDDRLLHDFRNLVSEDVELYIVGLGTVVWAGVWMPRCCAFELFGSDKLSILTAED